jgi:hypothetical protein
MKSSEFMRTLPGVIRPKLPKSLWNFQTASRAWLVQLYYDSSYIHYEAWNLGERRGRLEIGLHFESREANLNARFLDGMLAHLIEIKAELGPSFEAEPWDKGWAKVYETIPLDRFSPEYLEQVATRMAQVIAVLEPIRQHIQGLGKGRRRNQ